MNNQATLPSREKVYEQPKVESSNEKIPNRPEAISAVMNLINQNTATGNLDLINIVYGLMDYSLQATPAEIYDVIFERTGGEGIIKLQHKNGTNGRGIDLSSSASNEQKINTLTIILEAAKRSPSCTLEVVQNNNVKTSQESKEINRGDILLNDFINYSETNYNDIKAEYRNRLNKKANKIKEDPKVKEDIMPDIFYDEFYSGLKNNQNYSAEVIQQYQTNLSQAKQTNPLIKIGKDWSGVNKNDINEYPEKFIGRIYFNVEPAFGPKLLNEITRQLYNEAGTFQTKIPTNYEDRKDNCVLYFTMADQDKILKLIQNLANSNQFIFRDELGKGQTKLLTGIGFAQDATEGPTEDFRYYSNEDSNVTSFGGKLSYILGNLFNKVESQQLGWQKDKAKIQEMYEVLCTKHDVDPTDPAFHLKDNNFETIRNFAKQKPN